ncbi:MAG: FtsW/RodA/SpoVE family cell cycle protein [candidate division WOR-3 bacterium]
MRRFLPLIFAGAISAFSLVELFSVGSAHAFRQLIWIGLGGLSFLLFYKAISPLTLRRGAEIIYWVSVILLVAVLVFGGPGARRWFSFGVMKFQPSELSKLAVLLVLSKALEESPVRPERVFVALGYSLFVFILIFIEPDLATAGAVFALTTSLLLVSGTPSHILMLIYAPIFAAASSFWLWSFIGLVLVVFILSRLMKRGWGYTLALTSMVIGVGLATPLVWNGALKEYQRKRIISFVAPKAQSAAAGWQALQARVAIGSGGLWGRGYREGTQKGLDFLPEAHTDFIFAAIGEEFGFLGCALIVGLFAALLWSLVRAATFTEDRYLRNLGVGAMTIIFYHACFNLLSVLGLFPVAGLPLPFASYGGSHILMEFSLLGIVAASVEEEMRRRAY